MSQYLLSEGSLDIVYWCWVRVSIKYGHQGVLFMNNNIELDNGRLTLSRLSLRWPIVEKVVTLDCV